MVLVDRDLLGVPPEVLADPAAGGLTQTAEESSRALRAFSAGLLVAQEETRVTDERRIYVDGELVTVGLGTFQGNGVPGIQR